MIETQFEITQENLDYFRDKIGYDVSTYLVEFHDWYKNNMPNLVGFYSGALNEIDVSNFVNLTNLVLKSSQITNNIIINNHLFYGLLDWEMVEYFENLKVELWAMVRMDKFLRSTQTNATFTNSFEFNQTLKQNQNIEHILFDTLRSSNYNNDWVDVALRNDIAEVDYGVEGGNSIILSVNLNTQAVKINSIIDNVQGAKVFGLDVQKELEFESNDFKVLDYQGTIFQAVSILMDLMKGDVPEFLDLGRSGGVGSNLRNFAINSVVRELIEVFSSDDTLTNFKVEKAEYNNNGDFIIDFSVSTRLDLVINNQITV